MISVGVKNLAGLNMPGACERCFWLKFNFKAPWDIFPGIFSAIANHSAECMTALNGESAIEQGEWIKPPTWQQFQAETHQDGTEVNVRGQADYIQRTESGIEIYDFKTARYTPGQELLLPLYKAQLNAYAWIWERKGGEKVTKLGLVYCEPQPTNVARDVNATHGDFSMTFAPKLVEIDIDRGMIQRLAAQAAKILTNDCPKFTMECADCVKLDTIIHEVTR